MRNVVGIVNLHDGPHLGVLTEKRPLGAVTFLGRYGLMDFALSNLSNSGIDRIAILAENNIQAVTTHLGSGSIWVNNTVTGFVRMFSNEKEINSRHFNTDINNLIANHNQLDGLDADYVVVVPPFFLMSIDLQEVLAEHIASGKDATVVYSHIKKTGEDYRNCDEVIVEDDGTIKTIKPFTDNRKSADISLEVFVYNRKAFNRLVVEGRELSNIYNLRQAMNHLHAIGKFTLNAYKFDGYVAPILSLDSYVKYSFELLDYQVRRKLFKEDWPIYTTTHNTPPALYGEKAKVVNSFIANGSIINGKVINSIISRDVTVNEGAVVENSILFTKTEVGENVRIKYVLADKSTQIIEKKKVVGDEDNILCIPVGARI